LSRLRLTVASLDRSAALSRLLPDGLVASAGTVKPHMITHITFAHRLRKPMDRRYSGWSASRQWLWLVASGTSPRDHSPDPADEDLFRGLVRFSADWQALVLRTGVAFVGTSSDPGGDDTFHAAAQRYVRSIYLDVFLLGRMQLVAINDLANSIATGLSPHTSAVDLAAFEQRLFDIRHRLWLRHVTVRGKGNELLRQFQQQHRLDEQIGDIVANLNDSARSVEVMTNRSINNAVAVLTTLGLPFGVSYAAAAVLAEPSPAVLLMTTLVGLLLAVLATLVFTPVRKIMAGPAIPRRRSTSERLPRPSRRR